MSKSPFERNPLSVPRRSQDVALENVARCSGHRCRELCQLITDCREQLRCAVREFGEGSEQAEAIEEDLRILEIEQKASRLETEVLNALSCERSSVGFLRGLRALLEHWRLGDSYQRILDATDETTLDWDREVVRAAQALLSHRETEGSRSQEQEACAGGEQ